MKGSVTRLFAALITVLRRWLPSLLFLVLVTQIPVWGQSPATPNLSVTAPSLNLGNSSSPEVTSGDVYLDGQRLFTIAAPAVRPQGDTNTATVPVQERVKKIETTLETIANSGIAPKTLKITRDIDAQSRLPVIYLGDRYLMTVTTQDAQLQGQSLEQRAEEISQIVKQALTTAHQERQPSYLTRQAFLAVQLILLMLVTSWIVSRLQHRLQRQREFHTAPTQLEVGETLAPALSQTTSQTSLLAVQQRLQLRQQRLLSDVQRRALQLLQVSIWGVGSFIILGLFPYSRWLQPVLFSTPLKVIGIVLATYTAVRLSDVLVDRSFTVLTTHDLLSPDLSQRLALRITTFSRVLRSVLGIILIGVGILSALSVLGVELGPVLAGAGILGLAISFASQNLIKDMINGLLILSEDQYAVGDIVQIGKVSGTVEYMNLRITQLRNAEGRLITIPNSSITVVENLSKDWSRVDLAITIAYNADVDRAIELIQQTGIQMSQELEWQDDIPEPPEVLGIDDIGNGHVTLRVWIKTLPLKQWRVAREFRRRLKRSLDGAGIAIGLPPLMPVLQPQPNNGPLPEKE